MRKDGLGGEDLEAVAALALGDVQRLIGFVQ